MNKIAFIGVGIMGKSMVRNLMKAGFELHIYARTRSKVEDVIGEGAIFHNTIAELRSRHHHRRLPDRRRRSIL